MKIDVSFTIDDVREGLDIRLEARARMVCEGTAWGEQVVFTERDLMKAAMDTNREFAYQDDEFRTQFYKMNTAEMLLTKVAPLLGRRLLNRALVSGLLKGSDQ